MFTNTPGQKPRTSHTTVDQFEACDLDGKPIKGVTLTYHPKEGEKHE